MTTIGTRRARTAVVLAFAVLAFAWLTGPAKAAFGVRSYVGSLQVLESPLNPLTGEVTPGTPLLRAGAHPDLTVAAEFNVKKVDGLRPQQEAPDGNPRYFIGYGPPGLVGNPTAYPTCTFGELAGDGSTTNCAPEAQIGSLGLVGYTAGLRFEQRSGLYNLVPPPGVAAEFGANIVGTLVVVDARLVNREGTYAIALESRNISEGLPVGGFRLTLWGVPASPAHDSVRQPGTSGRPFGEVKSYAPRLPFVSNPTTCPGTPLSFSGNGSSWQGESAVATPFSVDEFGTPLTIEGCGDLPFEPSFSARPTTTAADSPTGLKASVKLPQVQSPDGVATSQLRDATIALPAGMTVNPGAANDLSSCSAAAAELDGEAAASCPAGSKLGTVEIKTPLLAEPLDGEVFLARQRDNKFGSLLGLYLTVNDPRTGIVLKLPGKIEASPSGQLTVSFSENPQLPFEELNLELFGGQRAALRTPATCGTYTSRATFTPWSGGPAVTSDSSFAIDSGPEGSGCPNGGFDPHFAAGTTNPVAGDYSPFVFEIGRGDGGQELASLTASLPQGLLARLAGVPYCSDAALAGISGEELTGAAQLASPSCPAASRIGRLGVDVGAGPSPFAVNTGSVYLAGPYKGAPLSLAVVAPAVAGPFDLGSVVVRTALQVDPDSTQVTAVSDPLPTVLHGVPLDLRRVRVELDRPDFTLNPTSCAATQVGAVIDGTGGARVTRANRFQVTECAALGYRPKLALSLSGATRRGGDPALHAVLRPRQGDANSGRVQVLLPRSSFIDQAHVGNPCTRVQFAAGQCPANSVLGRAKAYSPLLDRPLEGPVYFRSNGGERQLPDVVADLHGQIDVVLVGFIDSLHRKGSEGSRVRATFATVPDAPVSRFDLALKGGSRGLIENSADLCAGRQVATVRAVGQNGRVSTFGDPVRIGGCGGAGKKK